MGWFSNIFGGLEKDISGIGNWIGRETGQLGHWLSNPMHDLEAAGGIAAIALPFLAPEILGGLGAGAAGLGLTDLGAGLSGAGAAIGSTEADIAATLGLGGAADAALPTTADLAAAGAFEGPGAFVGAGTAADAAIPEAASFTAGTGFVPAAGADLPTTADLTAAGAFTPGSFVDASLPSTAELTSAGAFTPGSFTTTGGGGISDWLSGAASSTGNWFSNLGSNVGSFLGKLTPMQDIGLAGSALATGMSIYNRLSGLPYEKQLQAQEAQLAGTASADQALATQYGAPLATGTLPAPWQAAVNTAEQQGEDAIRSKYAQMGLSNSSSEAGEIAALKARVPEIQMQIAQQMAQVGLQYGQQALAASGLEDQIYLALMNANIQQDMQLAQALASFAGAAGRTSGVTAKAA